MTSWASCLKLWFAARRATCIPVNLITGGSADGRSAVRTIGSWSFSDSRSFSCFIVVLVFLSRNEATEQKCWFSVDSLMKTLQLLPGLSGFLAQVSLEGRNAAGSQRKRLLGACEAHSTTAANRQETRTSGPRTPHHIHHWVGTKHFAFKTEKIDLWR